MDGQMWVYHGVHGDLLYIHLTSGRVYFHQQRIISHRWRRIFYIHFIFTSTPHVYLAFSCLAFSYLAFSYLAFSYLAFSSLAFSYLAFSFVGLSISVGSFHSFFSLIFFSSSSGSIARARENVFIRAASLWVRRALACRMGKWPSTSEVNGPQRLEV